jgi:hypothetical protein
MQEPISRPLAQSTNKITPLLIIGDICSFLLFSAIGRSSHGEAAGFDAFFEVVKTAAPFMIGWFVVAPFSGALKQELLEQPSALVKRTLLTLVIALPIGFALRALFLQRGIPLSFAIVASISNLILMLGWRGITSWIMKRRNA